MKFLKILLPFCAFSGMDEEAPVYCQTENWNKVFINLVGAQKHFIMLINPILCWLVVKKKPEARTTKILPGTLLSYLIHQLPINYLLKFFFILSEAYNIKVLMYVGELGLIKV